jgi:hypothetical protein
MLQRNQPHAGLQPEGGQKHVPGCMHIRAIPHPLCTVQWYWLARGSELEAGQAQVLHVKGYGFITGSAPHSNWSQHESLVQRVRSCIEGFPCLKTWDTITWLTRLPRVAPLLLAAIA